MSHEYLPIKGLTTAESDAAWAIAAKLPPSPRTLDPSDPLKFSWEAALAALLLELGRYAIRYCQGGGAPPTPEETRQRAARLRNLAWYQLFAKLERNQLLRALDHKFGGQLSIYGYTTEQGLDACCDAAIDRSNTDAQIRLVLYPR